LTILEAVLALGLPGCSPSASPPPRPAEPRTVQYTPPDIPLARRKQVYREVRKLIDDFEQKTRDIRLQFAAGKISPRERDKLLLEANEKHEEELKATLGRYGLRLKDLPNILAEAKDKGWD
jgi:ribosome recycling factor